MRVYFYIPNLSGGGAERVTLALCEEFRRRGHDVELVVDHLTGAYADSIPANLSVRQLVGKVVDYPQALRRMVFVKKKYRLLFKYSIQSHKPYFSFVRLSSLSVLLRESPCDVLVAALGYSPFIAFWANLIAGNQTHVVCVEHTTPSRLFFSDQLSWRRLIRLIELKNIMRIVYPRLSAIVGVSEGVSEDISEFAQVERLRITTIHNPVSVDKIRSLAEEEAQHPWCADESLSIILAVGRLVPAKNFALLLQAFAYINSKTEARLIILGDGPLKSRLCRHAQQLGIAERVELIGWRDNPYSFMRRANVFVQSSDREGFSMTLVEALASGCAVVATDCKSGPREVLNNGEFGTLVPMHDAHALARAIDACLSRDAGEEQRLVNRAMSFSVERSVDAYESLFREIMGRRLSSEK